MEEKKYPKQEQEVVQQGIMGKKRESLKDVRTTGSLHTGSVNEGNPYSPQSQLSQG